MATAKEKRAASRAALDSFVAVPEAQHRENASKTAPMLFLQEVGLKEKLEDEVVQLKSQLAGWDGDAHTRLIDPQLVEDSKWANRHSSSFGSKEFAALKTDIASSGGNVQPIKVRQKLDGRFEVVFGHRRLRACKELGLPVLAMIAEGLDDVSLFIEMDRENRERADLSPWEQGVMYRKALESGLFKSNRELAQAVGVDLSNLGKCLALAKLPEDAVSAFSSPLEIQLRWGGLLSKAFESDPLKFSKRAKRALDMSPKPNAKSVFTILMGEGEGGGSEPPPSLRARVEVKKDGSAVIRIPVGVLDEVRVQKLQRLIDDFLAVQAST